MERAVEERLQQDKAVIQAVTQQEMRRLQLRNKIAALRNARAPLTSESQATDEKGNVMRGQRKMQNFFVSQDQVLERVMQRLHIPDETAMIDSLESKGSTGAASTDAKESDDECILEDDEQEVDLCALPTLFPAQRATAVVRPIQTAIAVAAPKPKKVLDEIDLALAEIAKQERRNKTSKNKQTNTKTKRTKKNVR